MRLNLRRQGGFTLVEVTIILLVLVILSMIMLPQLGNFNRLARKVKVVEDLTAICSVAKKMLDEVMLGAFYGRPGSRGVPIGLLVGPGATPRPGPAPIGNGATLGSGNWLLDVGDSFREPTDTFSLVLVYEVDTFENHLLENDPQDREQHDDDEFYKNPIDNPERWAAGAFSGWRGPYVNEFTTDPWNNRYMANTFALFKSRRSRHNSDIHSSAVVCYSAGPDGAIDTAFNQPANDADADDFFGWQTGDDDIAVVLSAGGPF